MISMTRPKTIINGSCALLGEGRGHSLTSETLKARGEHSLSEQLARHISWTHALTLSSNRKTSTQTEI
eukprot:377097-Amphidinium_carterae.1